jgi:hypothetical protein
MVQSERKGNFIVPILGAKSRRLDENFRPTVDDGILRQVA